VKRKAKTILIAIRTAQEAAKDAIDAWKRAERYKTVELPVDRIYFPNEEMLFRTLSTKRRELLKFLRQSGASSIKQLSEQLDRDYKNVHSDIKLLNQIGLIDFDKSNKVFVPWDNIAIEIALAA
jgi:predicted transcriptional regulator